MTAPDPQQPPQQTAPEQPARPAGGQAAAAAAALEEDESAIAPAMAAFVLAVLAFARSGGRVAGLPTTIAKKIGYDAVVIAAVTAVATRALEHQRTWAGKRAAEELWEHTDVAVAAGVDAALTTLARAAKVIAANARQDEAGGGSPGISLPGEPYDPEAAEHAKSYADPEQIALPVVQATRNATQMEAAAEAGWRWKQWHSKADNRVRVNHVFLNAKSYEYHQVGILEPFVTLDDNKLWYPGDTSAPVHEWMRCRCWLSFHRSD